MALINLRKNKIATAAEEGGEVAHRKIKEINQEAIIKDGDLTPGNKSSQSLQIVDMFLRISSRFLVYFVFCFHGDGGTKCTREAAF